MEAIMALVVETNGTKNNSPVKEIKIALDLVVDGKTTTVTLGYLGMFEGNDVHELLMSLSSADLQGIAGDLQLTLQNVGTRGSASKRKISLK